MQKAYEYDTPIGKISIAEEDGAIVQMHLNGEIRGDFEQEETPIIKEAISQLREYLTGKRRSFDLTLRPKGTEFQQKVWNALCDIPYGETRSYRELAEMVGNPKAVRAVGGANNKNPIIILVPCHRVIGSDGKLVGYAAGLAVKKQLLDLERAKK